MAQLYSFVEGLNQTVLIKRSMPVPRKSLVLRHEGSVSFSVFFRDLDQDKDDLPASAVA